MDPSCPACHAGATQNCQRINRESWRSPHLWRLTVAAAAGAIRLLWRALPEKEQVGLLADLSVDCDPHPVSNVSLYTMPLSDPGPEWIRTLDRLSAAQDLVQRSQRLMKLAHRLYSQGSRWDPSARCMSGGNDSD